MRLFFLGWLLLLVGCDCERVEELALAPDDGFLIRRYAVTESQMRELFGDWKVVEVKGGFESRFLKGKGKRGDCASWARELLEDEFEAQAIYDFESEALVVKTKLEAHGTLQDRLFRGMRWTQRAELKLIEEDEEIFRQSIVALPVGDWMSTGKSDLIKFSGVSQVSVGDDLIDSRLKVVSKIAGSEFEITSSYSALAGKPQWFGEVFNKGGKTVTMEILHERVSLNGVSFRDRILTEVTGKRPGFGARAIDEVKEEFLASSGGEKSRRIWEVHPRFYEDIYSTESTHREGESFDPFQVDPAESEDEEERLGPPLYTGNEPSLADLKERGALDVRELLMENGVAFRPGDFAVFVPEPPLLFVQNSKVNLDLIEGISSMFAHDPPDLIRAEVLVFESDVKLAHDGLRDEDDRVLKRVEVVAFGDGSFKMRGSLRGRMAFQRVRFDGDFEVNMDLEFENSKSVVAVVKTSVVIQEGGNPVVVSQAGDEDGWRGIAVRVRSFE